MPLFLHPVNIWKANSQGRQNTVKSGRRIFGFDGNLDKPDKLSEEPRCPYQQQLKMALHNHLCPEIKGLLRNK